MVKARGGETAQKDSTPPVGQENLEEMKAAKQTGTGNSCNRLHIFNVSKKKKKERSLEMKKGRKKKSLPFVFLSFEL